MGFYSCFHLPFYGEDSKNGIGCPLRTKVQRITDSPLHYSEVNLELETDLFPTFVPRAMEGQCIVCTRGIRIVCTRGTGSSLHAGLFCPGSFVHAVLTAMHKKGQGR